MTLQRGHSSWMSSAAAWPAALSIVLLADFTIPSLATGSAIAPHPSFSVSRSIQPENRRQYTPTSRPATTRSQQVLATASPCPSEIEPLTTQLILDLPSYSNRVIQRASKLGDPTPLYLIVAGQATVTPLSLDQFSNSAKSSRLPSNPAQNSRPGQISSEEIYQINFTTLERQYLQRRPSQRGAIPSPQAVEQQQNHWLILARNPTAVAPAWRVISLRSQLTPYPAQGKLLAPPRSSLAGPIGQGIKLWLRDQQSQITASTCANSAH